MISASSDKRRKDIIMVTQEKFGKLCKERMVKELLDQFEENPNFIITSFMGSSVADLESLRRNLRKADSSYVVVKNSILKVILTKLKLEEEMSSIGSGMGVSFSGEDVISTCKVLVSFSKDHDKFKIKSARIDGKLFEVDKIKHLASLPPRNVLIAQVVGGMKSPITGFVNVLGGVLRKFVYVVNAIKTSKTS